MILIAIQNGREQKTWFAVHNATTVDTAIENLRQREETTTANIHHEHMHFTSHTFDCILYIGRVDGINPENDSATGFELAIKKWLVQYPDVIGWYFLLYEQLTNAL